MSPLSIITGCLGPIIVALDDIYILIQLNWTLLLFFLQRCGRLDDQITLLRHKLYLIQQGLAFNGKRTKTARSQGKKFQVSVEQEATRLLVRMLHISSTSFV